MPRPADPRGARMRRVVVAHDLGELWLALLEDERVTELTVRPAAGARWLGTIAKGRISRLVPGVRAAFVDVGIARDLFTTMPPGAIVERHLAPGDEVLVQVTREAQGGKGHRATFEITIPGRALVLAPHAPHRGVSKRIDDKSERERLRALVDALAPEGMGLIARTAAVGLAEADLAADLEQILATWREVEARAAGVRAPAIVYREENLAAGYVRDHLAGGLDEVIVEGGDPAELAAAAVGPNDGGPNGGAATTPRVRAHDGPLPALEAYGLERALESALAPVVPLPGGGRLVLETTEALVAIDVNSGRDTHAADLEDTALRTNLEAVAEIARQVRLRDLAGLIVVDFIDVEDPVARAAINDALAAAFAADRSKTRILPLTDFCLAQITRQRRGSPLARQFTEACAGCGRGAQPRADARARRLLREVRRRARPYPRARVRVTAPPPVVAAAKEILADLDGAALGPWRLSWGDGPEHVEVEPG